MAKDERNIFEDSQGRKFYDFNGRRIPVNSDAGKRYDDLYKDLVNDIEAEKQKLEGINLIRDLLSGAIDPIGYVIKSGSDFYRDALRLEDEPFKRSAFLTGIKYGIDLNVDDLLDYNREMRDVDNPLFPAIQQIEDEAKQEVSELESLQIDFNNSDENTFNLVNQIEPGSTVKEMVTKSGVPIVQEDGPVVNPSGMQTAPPASAPDTSPVIQRGGGSSRMATVGIDQGGAAIIEEELAKGDDAFAGFAGFLGQSVPGTRPKQVSTEEPKQDPPRGTGPGSSLMQQRAADRSEIQTLLAEQFGGSAFFFEANQDGLRIGLTADGAPVAVDDPEAVSEISIMDYIVNNGITDQSRVLTILQKTEWWQGTDNAMRAFDVTWAQLSEPGKTEYLEPVMDVLDQEAQFLGFELSDDRKYILAKDIARMGESQDSDYIRTKLLDELEYSSMSNDISGFGAARDALQRLAYKYFTPLSDEAANDWAELIYTGEATEIEYEQFLKASAVSHFPTLDKVINEMGITPDQYFQPYKQKIESMLGRQVDMLDEFSDVIEYIPAGSSTSRPMTLSEVSKFVRALPEWQQTDAAKDQAKALSYAIGRTFGEVA